MVEIAQHMDMGHKQACIDLEKATQFITQVLQREVSKNQELCMLIRRLEGRELETGRSMTEQVKSNRQLRLKINELQKCLEIKDNSLAQANQTVALLRNEVRDLHRQLQRQQSKHRAFQEVNDWLQTGESQLVLPDSQSLPVSFDDQKLPQDPVSGIKEKKDADDEDEYGKYSQSVERSDSRTEHTMYSAADIKTELIQEGEDQPNMALVLSSKMDLSPADPVSLAQINGVSVELVDCSETQEQLKMKDEANSDGEQPEIWSSTSSSSAPLGNPTSSWTQQVSASSTFSTDTEDSRKFFNPLGSKSFSSQLKLHQRMRTLQRRHHCAQCGKSFHFVGNLIKHQRTHTGERPYHCTHCGRTFNREDSLKRHQRLHTGERPYHCSHCGKSFTQLGTLRTHQNVHTGERPYHCTQCGKSFTNVGNLKQHQRIHTGEKPYYCTLCGKSFTHEGNLKQHERIHTGERPFHCVLCGKSFSTKGNLKTHQLKHTEENP